MTIAQNPSIEQLQIENSSLNQRIHSLEEQIAWFKRQFFGQKTEKSLDADSLSLLDLIGYKHPTEELSIQEESVSSHTRKKPHRKKKWLFTFP